MARTPKNKAKRTAVSEKQKALNKEYSKQVKRIKQFLKRASERGYVFFDERPVSKTNKRTGELQTVISTKAKNWELPAKPKKVTEASIRKLKDITPDYLYDRAIYIDPVYGEDYTGQQGRKKERARASEKAAETRKRRTEVYTETARGYEELDEDDYNYDYDYYTDDHLDELVASRSKEFAQEQWLNDLRVALPPSEGVYQYILSDIQTILESLAPGEHRYTKRGFLWAIDSDKLRKSNALTKIFDKIVEEAASNEELDEYAMYLQSRRYDISNHLETARRSSKAEIVAANFEAIIKILNWDNDLEPHTSDALQRYVMGEIDDF